MKEEGEEAEDEEEEKGRRRSCIHTQESNHLQKATSQPRRPEPTPNELVCGFRLSSSLI